MSEDIRREFLAARTHLALKKSLLDWGISESEFEFIRHNLLAISEREMQPKDDAERLELVNLSLLTAVNNGSVASIVNAFRNKRNLTLESVV